MSLPSIREGALSLQVTEEGSEAITCNLSQVCNQVCKCSVKRMRRKLQRDTVAAMDMEGIHATVGVPPKLQLVLLSPLLRQ